MNRIVVLQIALGFLATLSIPVVSAQADTGSDKTLRFVAEFREGSDGNRSALSLDVTFFGARPDAAQAEETLRNCMKAAVVLHPGSDIEGKAWQGTTPGDDERQTVSLTSGDSLLYIAADQAFRSQGGGDAQAAANTKDAGDDLSWITQDRKVVGACGDSSQEDVAVLVSAGAENRGIDRKLIVKAIRAACKEQGITMDRKLRVCMSAISKAVAAAKFTAAVALPEDLPAAIARGKSAYAIGSCGRCHQSSGRGGRRGPDLTDDDWIHCDGGIEGIRKVLLSGVPKSKLSDSSRPSGMKSATEYGLEDQQIADLAIYVHSLSQN